MEFALKKIIALVPLDLVEINANFLFALERILMIPQFVLEKENAILLQFARAILVTRDLFVI
jgi:hypothetical protein